jgi:dihydroneopterin aldolase
MMTSRLRGLVPETLAPATRKIHLRGFDLLVDIGFHSFEVGAPQRLRVDIEIWLDAEAFATDDLEKSAWNYDILRGAVRELASARRYNLQETFCRAVYDFVAARRGVTGVRVVTQKPDIYPDCEWVGVELCSPLPDQRA